MGAWDGILGLFLGQGACREASEEQELEFWKTNSQLTKPRLLQLHMWRKTRRCLSRHREGTQEVRGWAA